MIPKNKIKDLPKSFKEEEKLLKKNGINYWETLIKTNDSEINKLITGSLASVRNMNRLKCIGIFICKLNLELADAALIMHSGISTVKALASLTPEELIQRTGRLERILKTGREPIVTLHKAYLWIKKANKVNN